MSRMEVEMSQAKSESREPPRRPFLGGEQPMSSDERDRIVLARMGKRQILKRNFGLLSMLSFSCTILITWAGMLILFAGGFINGGPIGLLGQFAFVWGGTFCTFVTIGELASMAPTAGGQYHWVAMLAPRFSRNFLSYMTGWMTILAWIASAASGAFLTASIVQSLCLVNWPDYASTYANYQGTLITWAVVLVCFLFNTIISGLLPKVGVGFMFINILGFFAILIPLLYYAPKATASELFSATNGYHNEGGWPTYGLSFLIGTAGAAFAFVGADAAVHMSEEISDSTINVPRSMVASVVMSGALGFGMLIAVLFCMGDVNKVLEAQHTFGFPFIQVFLSATQSIGGTTGMTSIIVALAFSATIGFITIASRTIWSFARDNGLPFSQLISQVSTRAGIPTRAVIIASIIPCPLALLNIGSTLVFSGATSLALAGFYSTYIISCSLLLWRRMSGVIYKHDNTSPTPAYKDEEKDEYVLTWGPWHVKGILGVINNVISICYLCTIWIFGFFPPVIPVHADTMNYSSLVFGTVVLYSILYYVIRGKRQYDGPVIEIRI